MPNMDHPAFLKEVPISAYPDPAVTLECADDYRTHWYVPPGTYAGHQGLDAYSSWHAPIYAVADGVVVETIVFTPKSGGWYGGNGSGTFVAIQTDGCVGCMGVSAYKHLTDFSVSVGQHVSARQQIGRQGTTGNSDGEHLHFDYFIGPDKDHMERYDPVPYLQGIKSWKVIREVVKPPEEIGENMANLVFGQTVKYTDSDNLMIHSEPNLDKTNIVGAVTPGEVCTIDAIINISNGMTMGHDARGWYSMGGPTTYWFTLVESAPVDTSAFEAQIALLGAEVNARDTRIASQDEQINALTIERDNERRQAAKVAEIDAIVHRG